MDSQTLVKNAPTILNASADMVSAVGTYRQGEQDQWSAGFEASQLDANAKARYAQGTQEAKIQRRFGEKVASDARAAAAAGGGVASDEQSIERIAKIKTEADYNALSALFEAESQAAGMKRQAAARRYEGDMTEQKGRSKSIATVLGATSKVFRSWSPADPVKKKPKQVWA